MPSMNGRFTGKGSADASMTPGLHQPPDQERMRLAREMQAEAASIGIEWTLWQCVRKLEQAAARKEHCNADQDSV